MRRDITDLKAVRSINAETGRRYLRCRILTENASLSVLHLSVFDGTINAVMQTGFVDVCINQVIALHCQNQLAILELGLPDAVTYKEHTHQIKVRINNLRERMYAKHHQQYNDKNLCIELVSALEN